MEKGPYNQGVHANSYYSENVGWDFNDSTTNLPVPVPGIQLLEPYGRWTIATSLFIWGMRSIEFLDRASKSEISERIGDSDLNELLVDQAKDRHDSIVARHCKFTDTGRLHEVGYPVAHKDLNYKS